jgi:catechol-2,3-dioxygenase
MIAKLQCVVLDCQEPRQLAEFYRALLGGTVNKRDRHWSTGKSWATLHTGSGLVLALQRVADHRPPQWPDPERPQQFHLDLTVPDLDEAQQQVLDTGATLLKADRRGWRIFADPAGHPFCLLRE